MEDRVYEIRMGAAPVNPPRLTLMGRIDYGLTQVRKIVGRVWMSVIGISFPGTVILRKVLKPKLIAVFIGVVTAGIIAVGFIFNMIMS